MRQTKWMLVALAAMALVGISAPVRPLRAEDQPNIEEMVRNAKSPADHQALAARYDKLAADAQSQAARHRTMAEAYKGPTDPKGIVRSTAMVGHCETVAKSFDAQAKEYKAMADAHREMAKYRGRPATGRARRSWHARFPTLLSAVSWRWPAIYCRRSSTGWRAS